MQISSRQVFNADPATTVSMLSNRQFLDELCTRSQAQSRTIDIAGQAVRVSMVVAAPTEAQRFTGTTLDLTLTIDWGTPATDGSREGTFSVRVGGLPVSLDGTVAVSSEAPAPAPRTLIVYTGELTVKIPLVGRTVERAAAPAITDVLGMQEQIGNEWLAAQGTIN